MARRRGGQEFSRLCAPWIRMADVSHTFSVFLPAHHQVGHPQNARLPTVRPG
jgi:hypothetical protein